jgi:O-acetyl-ADP-ribose deacetylase (regulator of RNase III)
MSNIIVQQGDITQVAADAIVNAANTSLLGGGGVDGAIHKAAGHELLTECKTLNGCDTGKVKVTKGYNLPARYVIHAVGPIWNGGSGREEDLLYNCYYNSMLAAKSNCLRSIAFPNISTGVYRFPKQKAAETAIMAVNDFLTGYPDEIDTVYFVCYDEENYKIYQSLLR